MLRLPGSLLQLRCEALVVQRVRRCGDVVSLLFAPAAQGGACGYDLQYSECKGAFSIPTPVLL